MLSKTFGRFFVGSAVLLLGLSLVGCDEPSDGGSYQSHSTSDLQVPKVTPVVLQEASEPDPLDWPYWRGPDYTGTSTESGLIDDWDPKGGEGSNVSWKRDDLGGRSTPIVMNGRLYLMCRVDPETATEGERVVYPFLHVLEHLVLPSTCEASDSSYEPTLPHKFTS
ncbi:MAG: hypothetical protein VB855_13755 [Pirellulaceae bacterium]